MVIVTPDHTQGLTHTHTIGRIPPDKRSARRRNLYVNENTQHSQETDIHTPARFEPTILA